MTSQLGRRVIPKERPKRVRHGVAEVNTRSALWSTRWPAIALQVCIDTVEAAPTEDRAQTKRALPCKDCPENTRCLNAKRKEIGPLLYDREILTRARSQESTLFPTELMDPMLDPRMEMLPHFLKPEGMESRLIVASAWDLAWSEKVGGDWLVCSTGVLDLATHKRRLIHMQRWQGLTYTQQCALIESYWRRFSADVVVIESDAAQVIYAQTLRDTTEVPVLRHTAADKTSLQIGVPSLLIGFDNERWEFPYAAEGLGFDTMLTFLAELEAFGWTNGRLEGVGEHDDTVMSFWHLDWGLTMMSGQYGNASVGSQPGRHG